MSTIIDNLDGPGTSSSNLDGPAALQPPVVRITPPTRWWVLPIAELWEYRELLYFYVWRELKVRYKQTVVGAAWAVIQPLMTMLVFSLFFGRLAHIPSGGLPYPVFYYSALLPWTYFAGALQNATNKVVDNQYVITKVYFPRLILPFSGVLSGLVDFCISFLMFVAIMIYYRIHATAAMLLLPAIYRDVRYVVPFLVQFWMFASPVAYPSSLVPAKWRPLYGLNPMAGVIEGFRWSLTGTGNPPSRMLLVSAAVVVAILVAGMMYFQKMESKIADVV
jgi:lipopolysaccharide transport system permease protein